MGQDARVKKERRDSLKVFRAAEKQTDTSLERLERRILRMLENKGALTVESCETLLPLYETFINNTVNMEKTLEDLLIIVNAV